MDSWEALEQSWELGRRVGVEGRGCFCACAQYFELDEHTGSLCILAIMFDAFTLHC